MDEKPRLNAKQKIAVAILDIVVLAELSLCLAYANQFQEDMTRMFLMVYVPAVIITLFIGKRCIRRLEPPVAVDALSISGNSGESTLPQQDTSDRLDNFFLYR